MVNNGLIDIVIVNWNAYDQLDACITSLPHPIPSKIASVIVVDNSDENKISSLCGKYPFISLITPKKNLGFGGGCNLGASMGIASFILFLNPDILFTNGSLDILIQFLESRQLPEDIGIIGAQLVDPGGSIQKNIARFPRFGALFPRMIGLDKVFPRLFPPHYQKDLDYSIAQRVDQVPGAFLLIRRQVFEALGGFDERFFMYYEDVDLSYRAHQKGWESLYLPQVKVTHAGGGTTNAIKATRLFYVLRSKILYTRKHFGHLYAFILIIGIYSFELVGRLVSAIMSLSGEKVINTIGAYIKLCGYLSNPQRKTTGREM